MITIVYYLYDENGQRKHVVRDTNFSGLSTLFKLMARGRELVSQYRDISSYNFDVQWNEVLDGFQE